MAEQQQDVDTLKRRGRRRLVGAVALVLLAVIVLPMVFDPEPRPVAPPISVRIPGEDEAPFKPKPVTPKAQDKKEAPIPEKKEVQPTAEQFIVPVGAFANPDSVVAKLAAANIPYYTEAAQGKLTRVRAGPFPTKAAADKAVEQVKGLGLKPGAVTTKRPAASRPDGQRAYRQHREAVPPLEVLQPIVPSQYAPPDTGPPPA
jgi:DedD protein